MMASDKTLHTAGNIRTTLNRTVLSHQVREFITDGILTGRIEPGERIIESAIANDLGVSQAPVREAIRELVAMGFLENEPFKGTFVRKFTPDELNEVYTVRAALESLGARQAASRITEQDGATLRDILDKMVAAAQEEDLQEMVRLNNEFHETIIKISGNKMLLQLWKSLQFGQWTILTTLRSQLELEFLAQRHEPLIEALLTRDSDTASEAMRNHIEELGQPH
jgi:DNA-binding GntR family transcriptional regulator